MAHPNEVAVRGAFAAFNRGDIDALRSQYWAEDIRFHVPGRSPLAGDYKGVAQVLEFVGRLSEASEGTFRAEPVHDVLVNDEQAVALFTSRAERAGKHFEDNTILVFRIRDGKITEQRAYPADLYAWDEFFS